MSFLSDTSRLSLGKSSRITIKDPVDPNLRFNSKNQEMRESLQSKLVSLGKLQTRWRQTESALNNKCELLVDQLRDTNRQISADQCAMRSQHLKTLDSMVKKHQIYVMDLQTQISEAMNTEHIEDPEVLALDQEIANLTNQIKAFEALPRPEAPPIDLEGNEQKRGLMEDRISQLKAILQDAIRKKEEDSKSATQMLQQLIVKNQETDDCNQAEIAQCIDELNKMEQQHKQQVEGIETEIREAHKALTQRLKNSVDQACELQHEVTKLHKQQKGEMKELMETVDKLKRELSGITDQNHRHLEESASVIRRTNDARREYSALHKELELLNAELARETIEYETLMRQLHQMDESVITELTQSVGGDNSTFSFSGF